MGVKELNISELGSVIRPLLEPINASQVWTTDDRSLYSFLCLKQIAGNSKKVTQPSVHDEKTGCCRESEGNGVSMGEGGEGRPGTPERGKDKQSVPNKGRDNKGKDEEDQQSRT